MKPIPDPEASEWMVLCGSGIPSGTVLYVSLSHLAIIILSLLSKSRLTLGLDFLSAFINTLYFENAILRNGSTWSSHSQNLG